MSGANISVVDEDRTIVTVKHKWESMLSDSESVSSLVEK